MQRTANVIAILKHFLLKHSCAAYIPYTKFGMRVIQHLYGYGFIATYTVLLCWNKKKNKYVSIINVIFFFIHEKPFVYDFVIKPTQNYLPARMLANMYARTKFFFLLTTTCGICSLEDATRFGVGGYILCGIVYATV